jgi:hypothetical protein
MRALPKIPEAAIPGAPFGIEVLKVAFVFFFLMSLVGAIPGLHSVHSEHFNFVPTQTTFERLISLTYAVLFAVGFYGIHRRVRVAWKVGWFYLGLFYLDSIISAVSSLDHKMPASERWVVSAIFVVLSSAVAVYWGWWWNKQKRYFTSKP